MPLRIFNCIVIMTAVLALPTLSWVKPCRAAVAGHESSDLAVACTEAREFNAPKLTLSQAKTALRTAGQAYKGTTRLGHALSKHAGRNPDLWGKVTGNPSTWHQQAMRHFREIYDAPGTFQRVTNAEGVQFLEKTLPDGRGIRLQLDYTFKGFID